MGDADNAMADDKPSAEDDMTVLHISNLTRNVREGHVREIFSCYGEVKSVEVPMDKRVGLSLGFAYVKFEKSQEAEEAAAYMDGGQIDGVKVKVAFVLVPKKRRESPARDARKEESVGRRVDNIRDRRDDRPIRRANEEDSKYGPRGAPPIRGRSRSPPRRNEISRPPVRDSRDRRRSPPRRPVREPPRRIGYGDRRGRSPPRRDIPDRRPRSRGRRSPSGSPRRSRDRKSLSRSRSPVRRRRYSRSPSRSSYSSSSSSSSSSVSRSRDRRSDRSSSTASKSRSRSVSATRKDSERKSRSPSRSRSPSVDKKD